MKTIYRRFSTLLLVGLGSPLLMITAFAEGQSRAEYRNVSSANVATQEDNPGVAFFGGYLKTPGDPQSGTVVLQESAFGQAFSEWFPSDTFARDILGTNGVNGVLGALYPSTSSTSDLRDEILNSGKPFRYKYLMYDGTGTDVTAFDATSLADWFNQDDRDAIAVQIEVLKSAVAASPFDTSLRNALLDVFYDLAVAEMQTTKPLLAKLATFRLGLEVLPPDRFIIDEEIDTYVAITDGMLAAVQQYTNLLSVPFPDIDPSSIDPDIPFDTIPMGKYIFVKDQARRSSVPTKFASQTGVQEVPQLDENGQIETPGTLFVGYKDLNVMLQIMGQRQQHLASLARLRGTRKAPGDLAAARASVAAASGDEDTQLKIIKSWFPELFPPDLRELSANEIATVEALLQQSGVLASIAARDLGRVELASITPLLNGSANMLGYDPDFLLLVQDNSNLENPRESYDVLRDMLTGPNQPLTVALEKLGTDLPPTGARGAYLNFQEKVDRVSADIDAADNALADRFFAITGFEPDASPGFDIDNPNPKPGSELGGALATIAALDEQLEERKTLTAEIDAQLGDGVNSAKSAVSISEDKEKALQDAGIAYKNATAPMYDEMIAMSAAAATAQAAYEAVADTASTAADASVDPIKGIAAATAATIIGVAGAVNTVIQGAAAGVIGSREQDIDYAGIDFSVTTESVDATLMVNQARQQLSSVKREQVDNNLAQKSDTAARTQAVAQRDTLRSELARITIQRNGDVAAIRKKSFADPLHYYRAENALIDADESFRTAQRFVFYTLQALNYKWHGRFATSTGTKVYDTSTVFKCRNTDELNDLLSQMVVWDADRVAQTVNSPRLFTRISLRDHVLARDPNRHDPNKPDDGQRADDINGPPTLSTPTLGTIQYFQKKLEDQFRKGDGTSDDRWDIPFSTAFGNQIADRVDGNFFRGASYDLNGNISDKGFWREKIDYVAVNIVADDGFDPDSVSGPRGLSAVLYYGGTVYFHTRVPPNGDRKVIPAVNPETGLFDDYPGELMISPFRFWVSPNFNSNFIPLSEDNPSVQVAYSNSSIALSGPNGIDTKTSFQNFDLTGRSIAASGWRLSIPRLNSAGFVVDVNKIKDIEIIVAYRHSSRVLPPAN